MSDDAAWIALSLLRHVGSKTLRALVATFGSAEAVLQASKADLMHVRGVGSQIAQAITDINLAQARAAIHQWQNAHDITIAPRYTPLYPPMLRDLDDEPATLFSRGSYAINELERGVAIIGTRNPSQIARRVAFQLGARLAKAGHVVISGLAHGIDGAAHHGALSVRGSHTLAILGSGVLHIYPNQHKTLAARILQHGAIISENHPKATPTAARLVTRNRIITGLCEHVIVVESSEDGGAMHAARFAQIQGKVLHTLDLPASGNQVLLSQSARCIPHEQLELWQLD